MRKHKRNRTDTSSRREVTSNVNHKTGFGPLLLRRVGGFVLSIVLIAAFYVVTIMAEPKDAGVNATAQPQTVLSASPAVSIADGGDLRKLLDSFPVQVLCCPAGGGLRLVSGMSYDVAYEGGFARKAEVVYDIGDGRQMTVISIYPSRAIELLGKGDWVLSQSGGAAMAGLLSVRMENDDWVRMHVQSENGLYAVILPKDDASTLASLLRPLQLLGGE